VIKKLENEEFQERTIKVIVDEGQDKPPEYYDSLIHLGVVNFFIVADQNQQITSDHSSRQELTDLLGLETEEVIELTENYRNSHPIAQFAYTFYTDPSTPVPNLPGQNKLGLGVPTLYEYINYQDCVKVILREFDRDNRNLIGAVVANDDLRDTYVKALETLKIDLDNPKPNISTYSSKDRRAPNINFTYSGIVVLNDRSIKGLEFDIVFIIVDGFKIYNNDTDSMKKRFYVMSSRAIKKLVLFKHQNYSDGVDQILTNDESLLKRKRLDNG
jgi:superfamily I DNA/RNA helicase